MPPYRTDEKTILGGVDLTGVDLTQPFTVDFSVPADSSITIKKDALERSHRAFNAFDTVKRRWLIRVDLDLVNGGTCVMYVYPIGPVKPPIDK
jgi:hypothetical protein